jgi:hypothetical protein
MHQIKKILIYGVTLLTFLLYGCTADKTNSSAQHPVITSTPNGVIVTTVDNITSEMPVLAIPEAGLLYHGIYPGGKTGEEDDITLDDLVSYENSAEKKAAWVYFSDNWYNGRDFPFETSSWIKEHGSIPYIRLMLRSDADTNHAEPVYTLDNILAGKFDADLKTWMRDAKDFDYPLIVEYGTEANGEWFSWNGKWNGREISSGYGDPDLADGPEKFRDAYRRIINLSREGEAFNIIWVFHVNSEDSPAETWNRMEDYYPGDEFIDLIGVSIYGAQLPNEEETGNFAEKMDKIYSRSAEMAPYKPIIVSEFGATLNNRYIRQEQWAEDAFASLTSGRWPKIIGFSWWNEKWENDKNPSHDTDMRVQDSSFLQQLFKKYIGDDSSVLGRPIIEYPNDP